MSKILILGIHAITKTETSCKIVYQTTVVCETPSLASSYNVFNNKSEIFLIS